MTEPGSVAWPPAPIRTERLVLREPEARDRTAVLDLFTSSEVGTYIGGPRSRDELERAIPESPTRRPGLFVVALDGTTIGMVTLDDFDPPVSTSTTPNNGWGVALLNRWRLTELTGNSTAATASNSTTPRPPSATRPCNSGAVMNCEP